MTHLESKEEGSTCDYGKYVKLIWNSQIYKPQNTTSRQALNWYVCNPPESKEDGDKYRSLKTEYNNLFNLINRL